jgi:hypothetical protein
VPVGLAPAGMPLTWWWASPLTRSTIAAAFREVLSARTRHGSGTCGAYPAALIQAVVNESTLSASWQ